MIAHLKPQAIVLGICNCTLATVGMHARDRAVRTTCRRWTHMKGLACSAAAAVQQDLLFISNLRVEDLGGARTFVSACMPGLIIMHEVCA